METKKSGARNLWTRLKKSGAVHDSMVFLVFVAIASVFWLILALNDSAQRDFTVRLQVDNVPDSVVFITDPPASFHVAVRDQGSKLFRAAGLSMPVVKVNFRDYADNGLLRLSHSDMNAVLKATFGKSAAILSTSLDSLRISYTGSKGKPVKVVFNGRFDAAPGSVVSGRPVCVPARATVYGPAELLDTLTQVETEWLKVSDIVEPSSYWVSLQRIPGVRVKPAKVKVEVRAEPLVRRETQVAIKAENVPAGTDMMLFPSKADVVYYVPMSAFSEQEPAVEAVVDYNESGRSRNHRVAVRLGAIPAGVYTPTLRTDSVEYSIVR